MKKPNILWILTDQQSAGMMSCAGNRSIDTPNMDRIAKDGLRFTNAYCTNPICMPSRFSLLSGVYPLDAAIIHNEPERTSPGLPAEVETNGLGKLLKGQGYNAVYGGQEHLPFTSSTGLGFDNICSDQREKLADTCADYIRNYRDGKPFAMVASFINPHDICFMAILDEIEHRNKRVLPEWLAGMEIDAATCREAEKLPEGISRKQFFSEVCPPLPLNFLPAPDEPEAIAALQTDRSFKQFVRESYTDERWRIHRWAYKNLTEKVDGQIGKLLDALFGAGLWEDTVIIFTSDHGDMDASHKMEHKECLYRECCNIPLIIKGIGGPAGGSEEKPVSNGLDIFPTILEYAGIRPPGYLEGFSLKENVQGTRALPRRPLVVECEYGLAATDGRYKYTHYYRGARADQFYDLSVNPGEMYNQIVEERYREKADELRSAIDNHLALRPARFGIGRLIEHVQAT